MSSLDIDQLLASCGAGEPGIHTQAVALFMNTAREKLGICFCDARDPKRVSISPGLANLINGNTFKTTMKRKHYDVLPEAVIEGFSCRVKRMCEKTLILIPWENETPFARGCALLSKLATQEPKISGRAISVDAMVLSKGKGEVADRISSFKLSKYHEVVMYEDRGENLSFMKIPYRDKEVTVDSWGTLIPVISKETGLERFCKKRAKENTEQKRDKAAMGLVKEPELKSFGLFVKCPRDHFTNAFKEFKAITIGTILVNRATCQDILEAYNNQSENLLAYRLKKASAAVYNNNNSQIIKGKLEGEYNLAYSGRHDFIPLDPEMVSKTGRIQFKIPTSDPIVITAKCTKNMLQDQILKTIETISGSAQHDAFWESWIYPKVTWINGVPGSGKTVWVIENYNIDKDVLITTTTETANYLRNELAQRIGEKVHNRVRTMDSILVEGWDSEPCTRLIVDKAAMFHFGAIVMAARLTGAKEILYIGDVNQFTYTDDDNLFGMKYIRPNLITTVNKELLCTHRSPMDVAYALNEIYTGIYSSSSQVRSMEKRAFTGANIQKNKPNTLFLVLTEKEKESLESQGYGNGEGSCILTVDEAQAMSYDTVFIMRTKIRKEDVHDSIPHAIVAVSRHTRSCIYYTDNHDEAIGYFVGRAGAPTKWITDYNLKVAIRNRDNSVIESVLKLQKIPVDKK